MRDRLHFCSSSLPTNQVLEATFERCRPLVTRVCRSRLSGLPVADIEDAVQETFLQFVEADRSRIINIEAWLITVALRVCAHTLRRRYRAPEVGLSEASSMRAPGEALSSIDEHVWLAQVAALMPSADVQLLRMLYIQDLPYGEVAQYLNVSNSHARVLAYRARQRALNAIDNLQ